MFSARAVAAKFSIGGGLLALLLGSAEALASPVAANTPCVSQLASAGTILTNSDVDYWKNWWDKEAKKRVIRERFLAVLSTNSDQAIALREWLHVEYIAYIGKKRNTVTLLLGNATSSPRSFGASLELVRRFLAKGYFVFYDGDAAISQRIAELAGPHGLGISGAASRSSSLSIKNPFLRLRALASAEKTVTTPDSVAGYGLYLNGQVTHVFDPLKRWDDYLPDWDWNLRPNLGVKYPNSPTILGPSSKAPDPKELKAESLRPFDAAYLLGKMDAAKLEMMARHALALTEGEARLEYESQLVPELPGGAVVFGAAVNHPRYTDLVYQTGRALAQQGLPVVTGGSVGYMEVANAGAYDAGGDSVGIPITGIETGAMEGEIQGERETAVHRHTLTVPTPGYEARIPLLLHRRPLIVMAPGGSGTMKELATALVAMGVRGNPLPTIVFLSTSYYGPVVHGLQHSALPAAVRKKFLLVDEAGQWTPIVRELERAKGFAAGTLRHAHFPTARNDHTSYVAQEKSEAPKGSVSGDAGKQ